MPRLEVVRWSMGSVFVVYGALFVAPPAWVRIRHRRGARRAGRNPRLLTGAR